MQSHTSSDKWQADVEILGGVNDYLTGREHTAYFDAQYSEFKTILTTLR